MSTDECTNLGLQDLASTPSNQSHLVSPTTSILGAIPRPRPHAHFAPRRQILARETFVLSDAHSPFLNIFHIVYNWV